MDADGRPWMAPRAGFELQRKFLSKQVVQTSNELDTPRDTPRIHALRSGVFDRSRATPVRDRNEAGASIATYGACLVSWIG